MAKFQSRNLRDSRKGFAGTLHNNTVLIKIHAAAHIGNVSYYTFFINNDFYLVQALKFNLIILYKRNLHMILEMILQVADHQIAAYLIRKQHFRNLLLSIPHISRNRHRFNLQRKKTDQNQQQNNHCCSNPCFFLFCPSIFHLPPVPLSSFL